MKTIIFFLLLLPGVVSAQQTKITGAEISTTTTLGVHRSSTTAPIIYSTTQTTNVACVTGSTLTVTSTGGSFMVGLVATANHATAAAQIGTSFKIDGVTFSQENQINSVGSSYAENVSWTWISTPVPAGVRNFCLNVRTNTGTVGFNVTQFWVMELR